MTHHILLHGSSWRTNTEKYLKLCKFYDWPDVTHRKYKKLMISSLHIWLWSSLWIFFLTLVRSTHKSILTDQWTFQMNIHVALVLLILFLSSCMWIFFFSNNTVCSFSLSVSITVSYKIPNFNDLKKEFGWFNPTFTAKVTWRSVMHMCFLAFWHQY